MFGCKHYFYQIVKMYEIALLVNFGLQKVDEQQKIL